jgi:hypothetical protein
LPGNKRQMIDASENGRVSRLKDQYFHRNIKNWAEIVKIYIRRIMENSQGFATDERTLKFLKRLCGILICLWPMPSLILQWYEKMWSWVGPWCLFYKKDRELHMLDFICPWDTICKSYDTIHRIFYIIHKQIIRATNN